MALLGLVNSATGAGVADAAATLEPALGNPSVSGYVLSSTDAGVRSWVVGGGGGGISDAPNDGKIYARQSQAWLDLATASPTVANLTVSGTAPLLTVYGSDRTSGSRRWQFTTTAGDYFSLQSTADNGSTPVNLWYVDNLGVMRFSGAYFSGGVAFGGGPGIASSEGVIGSIQMHGITAANSTTNLGRWDASGTPARLIFSKARSGVAGQASGGAVVNGDRLVQIMGEGSDGTDMVQGGALRSYVDGTPTSGVVPMRWEFWTQNAAGTLASRAALWSSGGLSVGSAVDPGSQNLRIGGSLNVLTSAQIGSGLSATHANTLMHGVQAKSQVANSRVHGFSLYNTSGTNFSPMLTEFTAQGQTTNATPLPITLDLLLDAGGGISNIGGQFFIQVFGYNHTDLTQIGGYAVTGAFRNDNAGAFVIVGTNTLTAYESNTAWVCTVTGTNNALLVNVTGAASKTINWVVYARILHVAQLPA
jgi:hypothetical protein